jgi:thioredoxin reductase
MIHTRIVETVDEITNVDGTNIQFVFRNSTEEPDTVFIAIGGQPELAIFRKDLIQLAEKLLSTFKEAPQ